MPPKSSKATVRTEDEDAETSVETVGAIFQQVHRSAAHAQKCKKDLIRFADKDANSTVNAVCAVVLLVLKQTPQLTNDALKRHYAFLTDVCRAFKEHCGSDALPVAIMRQLLGFHNANDKQVRLAVVTLYETLLKTVDQSNTSEERQDFYQDVAEMLKQRVHDKCPQVREKAVAAVAAFQTGKKNCDVSQQLIALLCTDTNADVRRQILRSIAPRKEFLEGYFHGMIRCTRDVVARVRAEAWDALGRFPWRYITAYATAKAVRLPELLAQGLRDSNSSVTIACRAALTNCWLHRDCRDECETMLDGIACGYVLPSLAPFELLSHEMLVYVQKRTPGKHFPLNLEDVNTSSLFMWEADGKILSEQEGEDETELLLPLERFAAVLQDAVYAYARPDAPPKTVKFRNVEDADNMLRILLSVFDIYEDNGYLAHADNTTRITLLRLLNFLLKVVPDDDPALFVDVAVRSLKALTRRTPEEATKTVTSALDSLFRSLKLPQRYALGFEDIEALGRKSRERQQELARRMVMARAGDASEEEVAELKAEMDRDEKFLLRMQLIVLAYLSHSERGDTIPTFSSHIIQLGRQQDNEKVKVAATKSLGLQCLISADTVHTFMPLILADAQQVNDADDVDDGSVAESVPTAAIGVIFDLVMEYGFKFFDVNAGATRRSAANGAAAGGEAEEEETLGGGDGAAGGSLDARLQREQELAEEDVHKVGSRNLLATLLSYLRPTTGGGAKLAVAIAGFCKLLSCNRVAIESVPLVMAELLCHFAGLQLQKKEWGGGLSGYLHEYLDKFFRSYTASHPKRQAFAAEAGVTAFWTLLRRNATVAARLMDYVTRISDAFTLTQIRDIDPEAAKRVSDNSATELDGLHETDATTGQTSTTLSKSGASSRTAAARSSMHSGRLLRELSRYSLHERIAEALLMGLAATAEETTAEQKQTCLEVLEKRMYFYSKDPQPFLLLCARKALDALAADTPTAARCTVEESEKLQAALKAWVDDVENRQGGAMPSSPNSASGGDGGSAEAGTLQEKFESRSADQLALLQRLCHHGFHAMPGIPPQPPRAPSKVKAEADDDGESTSGYKRERKESIFLEIDAALGSRRRPRR